LIICLGLYFTGMSSPESGTIGMIASFLISPIVTYSQLVLKK
jgi:hypothetical protein